MTMNSARLLAAAAIFLAAASPRVPAQAQGDATRKSIDDSRKLATQVTAELREQLLREMQASGPLRSLIVCKFTCPEIVFRQARRTGWRIATVSLKPRNPALGSPDAWEQRALITLGAQLAKGGSADDLEVAEVVEEPQGRFLRYARAIVVEPLCLTCHGPPASIPAAVRVQLDIDYPADKAVGFAVGQVYGIVAIKHAL